LRKHLTKIFLLISLSILVLFIIFLINQTVQVVQLAASLHPLFGKTVLFLLLFIYAILVIYPSIMYFRMPAPLHPPEESEGPAFEKYLQQLSKRLKKNVYLRNLPLEGREDLEKALKVLDRESTERVKKGATTVFVTTAISQSGRLDAFMVLLALIRIVWQVARVYYQRPSPRELIQLYANVAATVFIASELEDIDISQQIEPVIGSVLGGSLTGAIPGVNMVAGIVTNSLLTGAANAYLALRVGVIAQKYCGTLLRIERRAVRSSATIEAARLLSLIVVNSAGSISKAIMNAAIKSPGKISRNIIKNTWQKISGKDKVQPEDSPNS